MPPLPVAVKSYYGEMSIFDLLTNETVVKKLLSFLEQQNDENKESEENEGSNAAFLAQENQASNTIAGNEVYICLGLVWSMDWSKSIHHFPILLVAIHRIIKKLSDWQLQGKTLFSWEIIKFFMNS